MQLAEADCSRFTREGEFLYGYLSGR